MPCAGINVKSGESITMIPCQFSFEYPEDELMEVDGKLLCHFHAPLEDKSGNLTDKGEWTHHEINGFNQKILTFQTNTLKAQGMLNLSGVVFPGEARFQEREFPEVNFSHAQFNGHAYFFYAKFKGHANFSFAQFKGQASFNNAKFKGGYTFFLNSKFEENAEFETAIFSGMDVSFNNVKFKKTVSFQHSIFSSESAKFRDVEFHDLTIFQNARFEGRADFRTMGNNSDLDAFHDVVNFEGVEFFDYAIFENRNFRKRTIFKNCTFHKAPHFHGCRFHQDTNFTDARFLDNQGDEAARAYRTLKLDMEQKRARQEQLRFYALEMKSRRSEEKRKFLKFISWLYEATSDYGQRIFLPLAWLVYSFLVFAFFYAAYFKGLTDLDAASILPRSLHFSIKQIVRPFGVFGSLSNSGIWGKIPPSSLLSLPLIIAATLQSFLSLALLLLSGLAARWRFKIG